MVPRQRDEGGGQWDRQQQRQQRRRPLSAGRVDSDALPTPGQPGRARTHPLSPPPPSRHSPGELLVAEGAPPSTTGSRTGSRTGPRTGSRPSRERAVGGDGSACHNASVAPPRIKFPDFSVFDDDDDHDDGGEPYRYMSPRRGYADSRRNHSAEGRGGAAAAAAATPRAAARARKGADPAARFDVAERSRSTMPRGVGVPTGEMGGHGAATAAVAGRRDVELGAPYQSQQRNPRERRQRQQQQYHHQQHHHQQQQHQQRSEQQARQQQPPPPPPPPPPQPPEFVLHVAAVLRWAGVRGLTPEVLRRAKRGFRDEGVAAKMWQALLRVALLHLDSLNSRVDGGVGFLGSGGLAGSGDGGGDDVSGTLALGGGTGVHGGGRVDKRKKSTGEGAVPGSGTDGGCEVPVAVAVETCGYLLPLWGYRRPAFVEGIKAGDTLRTREILLALSWLMAEAMLFPAFEQASFVSPVPPPPPHQQQPEQGQQQGQQQQQQQQRRRSPQSPQTPGQLQPSTDRMGQRLQQSPHETPQQHQQQQQQYQLQQEPGQQLSAGYRSQRLPSPPPFPADICETPEVLRLSRNVFAAAAFGSAGGDEATAGGGGEGGSAAPSD
ncbi:unnamed protein product, partial [Scytosiphon promiscuus]